MVVLATSGYHEIFSNFLCSIAAIDFRNMLVLTSDENIARLADMVGIGVYMPNNYDNSNGGASKTRKRPLDQQAEFGSLSYQELMLFRTETVMNLLRLGFRVLVSDIDTGLAFQNSSLPPFPRKTPRSSFICLPSSSFPSFFFPELTRYPLPAYTGHDESGKREAPRLPH